MFALRQIAVSAVVGAASVVFVGCAEQRADIPATAQEVSSGNNRLGFTATQPGWIAIEDMNDQSIVYRGKVSTGDSVVVDPGANQITVNGTVVSDKHLHGGDMHKIFFTAHDMTMDHSSGY